MKALKQWKRVLFAICIAFTLWNYWEILHFRDYPEVFRPYIFTAALLWIMFATLHAVETALLEMQKDATQVRMKLWRHTELDK